MRNLQQRLKATRSARVDGATTRAQILESAGTLVAANGFAETTSKAIAAHAGVDLASINYHFGNRDGLYRATLVEAHRRLIRLEDLQTIAHQAIPPEDKLRRLLDKIVGHVAGGPHWSARVLGRELASPSSHIAVLRDEEAPPKLDVVLGILSEITGIPVGKPALMSCLVSVAAPCAMLMIVGENLPSAQRGILHLQPGELSAHLQRFALAGLKAAAEDYVAKKGVS